MRWVVGVVTTLVAGAASAQPSPEPPSTFQEGRELLDAGKFDEACAKFEDALTADSTEAWGTMLNLGLCNEGRDRLATALKWFRKAQTRASETGRSDYEAAAKGRTAALTARVPTVRLALTHAMPAGAYIAIDGVRVDVTELGRVELDAGRHVVELRGAQIPAQTIDLADGDHETVTVLVPIAEPERRVETVEIDVGRPRKRAAYAIAAGGGALLVGATVLGVVGKAKYDASEHPGEWRTWQDVLRYGGTTMVIVGAGALATAVYLYVTAPGKRRVERTIIVPTVGANGVGVSIGGGF
jgi:hypothetical protein